MKVPFEFGWEEYESGRGEPRLQYDCGENAGVDVSLSLRQQRPLQDPRLVASAGRARADPTPDAPAADDEPSPRRSIRHDEAAVAQPVRLGRVA